MSTIVTGPPEPLGFTQDGARVAVKFPTAEGATIIELPVVELPHLTVLTMQLAHLGATRLGRENEPPQLTLGKWEVGAAQDGDVALQLHLPGGGAVAFRLTRTTGSDLHHALGQALGHVRPN